MPQPRDQFFVFKAQPHRFLELRAVAPRLIGDGREPSDDDERQHPIRSPCAIIQPVGNASMGRMEK
jgi:hypothetical protein